MAGVRRPLASLVLLECALAFWLIAYRRMVRGHDAFQYFNGAATARRSSWTAIRTLLALNALAWVAGLPWLVRRFSRNS